MPIRKRELSLPYLGQTTIRELVKGVLNSKLGLNLRIKLGAPLGVADKWSGCRVSRIGHDFTNAELPVRSL